MKFEDVTKEFSDYIEMKAFAETQYSTIIELNKKINVLTREKEKLEEVVRQNNLPGTDINLYSDLTMGSDEETIAKIQLSKLKELSMTKELTLEEAKRVEIFSKILIACKSGKGNKDFNDIKEVDTKDLLKLVDFNSDGTSPKTT